MKNKTPPYPQAMLMEIFRFKSRDLAANREGRLTLWQENALQDGETDLLVIYAIVICYTVLIGLIVLVVLGQPGLLPFVVLQGLGALVGFVYYSKRYRRVKQDTHEQTIATVQGKIQLEREFLTKEWFLTVGQIRFLIPPTAVRSLNRLLTLYPNQEYIFYYGVHSKKIISAEPILVNVDYGQQTPT